MLLHGIFFRRAKEEFSGDILITDEDITPSDCNKKTCKENRATADAEQLKFLKNLNNQWDLYSFFWSLP